jgi:hypothetical protein
MTVINRIAYYQNRRDEVPNQELAHHLAEKEDTNGIQEIASHLLDKNDAIASDCLKVLYEVGYLKPELIRQYHPEFIRLLTSRNNRMVWGGMIALSSIAPLAADEIWDSLDLVIKTIDQGSVITQVSGIKTLVLLAATRSEYKERLVPVLLKYLTEARPVDFVNRLETLASVMSSQPEREQLKVVIGKKIGELTLAQQKRLKTAIRRIGLI